MTVNICGIPHEVKIVDDVDPKEQGMVLGEIDHEIPCIRLKSGMSKELTKETLIHEMLHGILVHLGYTKLSNDEQFVQALANGIYHGFEIREVE